MHVIAINVDILTNVYNVFNFAYLKSKYSVFWERWSWNPKEVNSFHLKKPGNLADML